MTRSAPSQTARRRWAGVLAASIVACGIVFVYWRLLLTNRVLASGDVFTYFTPYRDFANAALRSGQLPLWNPYLFLGVPFLANPQAAVLYPLHWPFVWLDAAKSLVASMGMHLWIAGFGMLLYAQRVAGLSWLAASASALVFCLSGFVGARVGQINQLSAIAWLPWLLWLLEETAGGLGVVRSNPVPAMAVPKARRARPNARGVLAFVGLTCVIALQLLAGHTQSSFINLVGLGLTAAWPGVAALLGWAVARLRRSKAQPDFAALLSAGRRLLVTGAAVVFGAMLAAPQLLPTWELSQQSIRAGGLSFREAVSFSLQPTRLLFTLLPTYGDSLAERFGTPAFGEFVAYAGVTALVLAAVGVISARRTHRSGLAGSPAGLAIGLGIAGLALALGLYNPLTFVLYQWVPGFDLFRAPARWMILALFGVSVLTGYGLQAVPLRVAGRTSWRLLSRRRKRLLGGVAVLAVIVLVLQRWPAPLTLLLWLVVGLVATGLAVGRSGACWRRLALVGLIVAELAAASLALEHTHPTAPEAVSSLRTAPAHLVAAARQDQVAGQIPGRFLSLSGITYDPGDLADIEQMLGPQLPAQAVYDFVVASKLQEIVAPNLPMLWRLPAVDGYDGGVLPLRRYVDLQTLFLPLARLAPDGRLREQLESVPAGRLLRLLGVQHVITDKGFDVWYKGVYYDLELANPLAAGESVTIERADRFEATGVGIFSYLDGAANLRSGTPVAEITVEGVNGSSERFVLEAGADAAEGRWNATAAHSQPAERQPWPREQNGWNYLTQRELSTPLLPRRVIVRSLAPTGTFILRGITLLDDRTGAHAALTLPSDADFQRIHSGDVKVYRALDTLPRAYLAGQAIQVADDAEALLALADAEFEPAERVVLLESEVAAAGLADELQAIQPAAGAGEVRVEQIEPERMALQVDLPAPGVLVLSDSWYPGWQVTVDGQPAPILRANLLFRAVMLPEGVHDVVFEFRSTSLRLGLMAAIAAVLLLFGLLGFALFRARRSPDTE